MKNFWTLFLLNKYLLGSIISDAAISIQKTTAPAVVAKGPFQNNFQTDPLFFFTRKFYIHRLTEGNIIVRIIKQLGHCITDVSNDRR